MSRLVDRNLKLTLEYDGTSYQGFQKQRSGKTIQETLEKALTTLCQEPIRIVCGARTDSGVHARGQVCHFHTKTKLPAEKLLKGLNSLIPRSIVAREVQEVSQKFHARYSAVGRAYAYFILNRPTGSAHFHPFVHWFPFELDHQAMNKACKYLVGKKDFSSFMTLGSSRRNFLVSVKKASCFRGTKKLYKGFSYFGDDLITFYIEADSFLYNMVRIIVGTLLEIGQGKRKPEDMRKILKGKNRALAGPTAPAKGLFLIKIAYP